MSYWSGWAEMREIRIQGWDRILGVASWGPVTIPWPHLRIKWKGGNGADMRGPFKDANVVMKRKNGGL